MERLARWVWEKEARVVIALALAAVALRVGAGLAACVISQDGARYVCMARAFSAGDFAAGLAVEPLPPLYPLSIALGHAFGLGWEVAGVAVSALASVGALLAVYGLASLLFDRRVAAVAGAIYAWLPEAVLLGGDVMTESLFFACFLGALALGWSGLSRDRPLHLVLAGVAAAFALLTRPEGVYLAPLAAAALGIHLLRPPWSFARAARAAGGTAAAVALVLVLSFPYLLYVRSQVGRWAFTPNRYARQFEGFLRGYAPDPDGPNRGQTERRAIEKHGRLVGAAELFGTEAFRDTYGILLAFFAVGCAASLRRTTSKAGVLWLHLGAAGSMLPPVLSFWAGTPFSHRYLLLPFLVWIPVMAAGAVAGVGALRPRWREAALAAIALVGIAGCVSFLRPRRTDKVHVKEAGVWIREAYGPGLRVMASDARTAHYAEGTYVRVPDEPAELIDAVERGMADVVVLRTGARVYVGDTAVLELTRRYGPPREFAGKHEGDVAVVFRVRPPP